MPVPTANKHMPVAATKHTNPDTPTTTNANTTTTPTTTRHIDFSVLTLASLRKYKRVHHLRIKPTVSKAELVQHVSAHFFTDCRGGGGELVAPTTGPVETKEEQQMIDDFVMAVRRRSAMAAASGDGVVDVGGKTNHATITRRPNNTLKVAHKPHNRNSGNGNSKNKTKKTTGNGVIKVKRRKARTSKRTTRQSTSESSGGDMASAEE